MDKTSLDKQPLLWYNNNKKTSLEESLMFLSKSGTSIELLGVFKISRKKYVNIKSHPRSYDTISIRLKGSADFKTKTAAFSVGRGDLLYLSRDAEYQQASEDETIIAIHFINYSSRNTENAVIMHLDDSEYTEELITRMYNVWKELNTGYMYKCTSLLYELLYYIHCREQSDIEDAITNEGRIKNALEYIHANYRKAQIEASELADICALSVPYFRKLFKKIHGISPIQYIINLKLDFASHLLQSELYTVEEVALHSGFSDTKYFSRLFKSRFGSSPKQYQIAFKKTGVPYGIEQTRPNNFPGEHA